MIDIFNTMSTLDLLHFYIPKILMATLCGGMVGVERELKHRPTGIKTNIMICVGSTMFAATSFLLASLLHDTDPARIAAQIVTGIGFLGAGAIFRADNKVRGLTSAALIWVLGAIGIMIGAGGYLISFLLTCGLVAMILTVLQIEKKWFNDNGEHDL